MASFHESQKFRQKKSVYGTLARNARGSQNSHGRSQDFSRGGGGGGHTLSNRVYSRFRNLNIVGCLSKKRLTRGGGGGHGHPRTPPGYALDCAILSIIFPLTGNGAFLCVQDVVVDLPWRKDANKVFFREVNANK